MTYGIINVTLNRDGHSTPWGFRLHGGRDIGYPLAIQRVFLGSPSERELQRGDIVLSVNDYDCTNMTHMEAHDVIKSAGNQLRLLVHRLPGAPQTPTTPTSPGIRTNFHPLSNIAPAPATLRAPSFQPSYVPKTKSPQPTGWHPGHQTYRHLPTTPVMNSIPPPGSFLPPSPQNTRLSEIEEFRQEKNREQAAIANQGYRTFPLITPELKTRHDVPMGSYLRHVPSMKKSTPPPLRSHFTGPSYSTPRSRLSGAFASAPIAQQLPAGDGSHLVHLQYNSPLGLYSREAVAETIKEQTGLQPENKPREQIPLIKTKFSPAVCPSGPLSPTIGGALAPARPGTKLTNIVDITLSPTFQLIQEAENRSSSPKPELRPSPTPARTPVEALSPKPNPYEQVNFFGSPKEIIHQSGSFKTLMATLALTGQQEL